ncbi:MAG: ATP-binding cassette domain-containing protein [Planctomycetota bacterium]
MIEVKDLRMVYGDGTVALDGVSATFPREHIFAVLGQSGSGKTTLLNCIARFIRPTSGDVLVDGNDVGELSEDAFRKRIGVVFQKLHLFPHLTILENTTLAPIYTFGLPTDATKDVARAMLGRLGIGELANNYPSQVSGGQAQRAAIARGLMLEPETMLLDEPTSALDVNTTTDFAEWLTELKEKTNFIIVTHDIPFAEQVASRGVLLENGRLVAAGVIRDIVSRATERAPS